MNAKNVSEFEYKKIHYTPFLKKILILNFSNTTSWYWFMRETSLISHTILFKNKDFDQMFLKVIVSSVLSGIKGLIVLSPEKHVSWVTGICIIHRNPLTFLTVSIQMSASCNCFLPLKKCPLLLVFTRFSEDFGNAGRFRLFNLQSFQIEFFPLILGNRYNLVHVGLVWLLKISQRIQITSNILFYYRKAWKNLTKLRKPYIRVFACHKICEKLP